MMATIEATNTNVAEDAQPSDQQQLIKQVTEEVMKVFDEQADSMDKMIVSYWRQMLAAKAETNNIEFQNIEMQEQHEEEVEKYKKEIAELKEKLAATEATLREREEELQKLRTSMPPGLS
ncbi:hypothetical protein CPB86DRAFT_828734 [Serendipita vermifera]|nr:hypothetical protein CPB86DRAFT_828734 [Serendipita vermifera]